MRSLIVATVLLSALLCVSLPTVSAKRPKFDQLEGYTFAKYSKDFSKQYSSGSKNKVMREKLFLERLISIQAHNADASRTYNQGVNDMTDWTEAERQQLMGNRPAMKHALKASPKSAVKVRTPTPGPLPKSVDYRTASPAVLTGVKSQGGCGSCWAHAATEEIESMWAIATGELFVLSQQQITSCTPNPKECGGNGGCGGAIAELGFDYVATSGGIQQEWTYPYTSYFGNSSFDTCKAHETQKGAKIVANLTGYTKTISNEVDSVAEALANVGPLAVSVDASHWFEYEGGVFTGCNYAKNISMDHAVQLVGYGHDWTNKMDYWIVRNSWAPSWGEAGFIRLDKPAVMQCGLNVNNQNGGGCKGGPETVRACGTCGIAWDAIYPNVKV